MAATTRPVFFGSKAPQPLIEKGLTRENAPDSGGRDRLDCDNWMQRQQHQLQVDYSFIAG
ncbi:MAG TPA: hypothetical protein VH120_05180 [Gemmataceae bacterium]|jgi:hypothetical protein|nr:hypothetical protein [Gemmataceae bacterium]